MLVGKNASSGIGIAPCLIISNQEIKIESELHSNDQREIERFTSGLKSTSTQLKSLYQKVLTNFGDDKAQIFEAHLLILEDPEFVESVKSKILDDKFKSTRAVFEVSELFITMFEGMEQDYLRERAQDIKDVTHRLLRNILNISEFDLTSLEKNFILVANDITPSQMASLDIKNVSGIITEVGGKTSHTAIMARTLELPAVVGLKNATTSLVSNELIICDGDNGIVIPNPTPETLKKYNSLKEKIEKDKIELSQFKNLKTFTSDHHQVYLESNIASVKDLEAVLKNGAEGIGLFRTEFIFMDRNSAPSEEEQFEIYKAVLSVMGNKPAVIRTLDVGGDKNISYLKIPKEENPFLGLRALRYCLLHPDIFKTQLKALLRASVYGHLHIMFPMVSSLDELLSAKYILNQAKEELTISNVPFSSDIKVGIMIEIPSAAMITDLLSEHVDFFSIGTNDLIQYMCAVDRMNEQIHDLYDPFHPGVLRIINHVIKSSKNKPVAMCGEMASNELLTSLLIGMGLSHFSMTPSSILKIRKHIKNISFEKSKKLTDQVLSLSTSSSIKDLLNS
jgi:phosphotransferase system enzyme I (PtsI)